MPSNKDIGEEKDIDAKIDVDLFKNYNSIKLKPIEKPINANRFSTIQDVMYSRNSGGPVSAVPASPGWAGGRRVSSR